MWIKICGITDPSLARAVAACGPDAIGLNFFARSPRCISLGRAAQIVAELPDSVEPIGLFVNHSTAEILRNARTLGLRTVQLHGDEPAAVAAELEQAGLEIIRAFRVGGEGLAPVAAALAELRSLRVELRACLIDARVEGSYGGTGHRAPWEILSADWRCEWPPLVLAGGLRPENVAEAIATVGPWGVDTASGVEAAPGQQDLDAVRAFIQAARRG